MDDKQLLAKLYRNCGNSPRTVITVIETLAHNHIIENGHIEDTNERFFVSFDARRQTGETIAFLIDGE